MERIFKLACTRVSEKSKKDYEKCFFLISCFCCVVLSQLFIRVVAAHNILLFVLQLFQFFCTELHRYLRIISNKSIDYT